MADPLSIAASVVALVTTGTAISHGLSQLINNTRSAPSSIRSLNNELSDLCKLLGDLSRLLDSAGPHPVQFIPLHQLSELLDNIMSDFLELKLLVNAHNATSADGLIRQFRKQISWVFKEGDVQGLRKNIEAYKATLNLTISLATYTGMSNISTMAVEINSRTQNMESEIRELRALCEELRKIASGEPANRISRIISRHDESVSAGKRASTYRAASFIDLYCSRVESVYAESIHRRSFTDELQLDARTEGSASATTLADVGGTLGRPAGVQSLQGHHPHLPSPQPSGTGSSHRHVHLKTKPVDASRRSPNLEVYQESHARVGGSNLPYHANARIETENRTLDTDVESNTPSIFPSFRIGLGDLCSEVIRAALQRYNIQYDWRTYELWIVYGDQKRFVALEEKPLVLFKELNAEGRKPMFMLRRNGLSGSRPNNMLPGDYI